MSNRRGSSVDLQMFFSAFARLGASTLRSARFSVSPVLLHLLIYNIADGTLALSFANLDSPGDNQLDYFGCAKLAVLKSDATWTEIKGPSTLHNKGIMVRTTGMKNNREAINILERIPGGG